MTLRFISRISIDKSMFRLLLVVVTVVSLFPVWGQNKLFFSPVGPDPFAAGIVAFSYFGTTPTVELSGDSLLHTDVGFRAYKPYKYLITDTARLAPVYFQLIIGIHNDTLWMVPDVDYDGTYDFQLAKHICLPNNGNRGDFNTETQEFPVVEFKLAAFTLTPTLLHPSFSIFVQPVRGRSLDGADFSLEAMGVELLAGYKSVANALVNQYTFNVVYQHHTFAPYLYLLPYYNPRNLQMSVLNLLNATLDYKGDLLGHGNGFGFFMDSGVLRINQLNIKLVPVTIDFVEGSVAYAAYNVMATSEQEMLLACSQTEAIQIDDLTPFSFTAKDTTVLYFTGSWCAPCLAITPSIEVAFKELPPHWRGIAVATEKNIESARKYFARYAFETALFEPLGASTSCSLKHIFSVSFFPALVYIGPDGKVFKRSNGLEE